MERVEHRAGSRVRCGSAAAYVTQHRHSEPALVTDLSHTGMQLRGTNLPEPGTWVSLIFVAPPRELGAVAHVAWKDSRRGAIGVSLERGTRGHDHDLAATMLALAFEAEGTLPGVLLLADDPGTAAELCEPLRRRGFLPRAPLTMLEAIDALERERPRISLAVVAGRPFGMNADQIASELGDEFPHVAVLPVEDLDDAGYMPRL